MNTEIDKLARLAQYIGALSEIHTTVQRWNECKRDKMPSDVWWAYLARAENKIGEIITAEIMP